MGSHSHRSPFFVEDNGALVESKSYGFVIRRDVDSDGGGTLFEVDLHAPFG